MWFYSLCSCVHAYVLLPEVSRCVPDMLSVSIDSFGHPYGSDLRTDSLHTTSDRSDSRAQLSDYVLAHAHATHLHAGRCCDGAR